MSQTQRIPRLGVSVCLLRGDEVLLAKRGKPPGLGLWSLPGGHVEWGESLREAAMRELMEETGLSTDLALHPLTVDAIRKDDAGNVATHYVIAMFTGSWQGGEPSPGDDAADVRWFPVARLHELELTPGILDVVRETHRLRRN